MDLITVGALLFGTALGLIIMAIVLRKRATSWHQQLDEAWHEIEQLKKGKNTKITGLHTSLENSQKELQIANKQINALQKSLEQQKSQSALLQETERARVQAVAQAGSHLSARQQAEGRAKQAEELASRVQVQNEQLKNQIAQATQKQQVFEQQIQQQNAEIKRLRTDIISLKEDSKSEASLEESVGIFSTAFGSLDEILKTLIEKENQHAAVLADANGIVVSAVANADMKDGIAASTQVVTRVATQLEGLIPFGAIKFFTLQDEETCVICGGTFACDGQTLTLATYGNRIPARRTIEAAITSLLATLE